MRRSYKSKSTAGKESIWSPAFISIFVINIILNLNQFMTTALIPKFAAHLGATATIIGIVTSMFAITALGVRPIVGPSSSYFKKIIYWLPLPPSLFWRLSVTAWPAASP